MIDITDVSIRSPDLMKIFSPDFYDESPQMNAIWSAQGKDIDAVKNTLNDMMNQLFIETATWGLSHYERQYNLPIDEGDTPESRREKIMAKKRRGRTNLVGMLRGIEPTIWLAWGRLILPLTLVSDIDVYDFKNLVTTLEKEKPSHLGYSFRVLPDKSGYTVYADHPERNRIDLQPLCGTTYAGRYPRWDTKANVQNKIEQIHPVIITGSGIFNATAGLYSGDIKAQSNSASMVSVTEKITAKNISGSSIFFSAGSSWSGSFPVQSAFGYLIARNIQSASVLQSGYSSFSFSGKTYPGNYPIPISSGSALSKTISLADTVQTGSSAFDYVGELICGKAVA